MKTILLCWACGAIGVLFGWVVRHRMEQASADIPRPVQAAPKGQLLCWHRSLATGRVIEVWEREP